MTQAPTLTGQDLAEAQGAVRALLDHVLEGTGTTSDEYVVLRVLSQRGPWDSPAALHDFLAGQRQLRLDATAVADLLAGLENRGLVTGTDRAGAGPARLTAHGESLHAELGDAVAATTRRLYGELDAGDLAVAHRVLVQVTERAHRLRGAAGPDGSAQVPGDRHAEDADGR
jgi:DNA-binding MarR family transcriptional regulator